MKNLFTIIAVLFFFTTANSQIVITDNSIQNVEVVGKANNMGTNYAKLETDNNGTWILTWRIGSTSLEKSFKFGATKQEMDAIYNVFIEAFNSSDPKNYKVDISISPTMNLTVRGEKVMGVKSVSFGEYGSLDRSAYLTKAQVNSLFGK
jgi:hypothetical protein